MQNHENTGICQKASDIIDRYFGREDQINTEVSAYISNKLIINIFSRFKMETLTEDFSFGPGGDNLQQRFIF